MCAAGAVESLPLPPWNKKKKKKSPASVLFQADAYPDCGSVAKINLITLAGVNNSNRSPI